MANDNIRSIFGAQGRVAKWPKKTAGKLEVLKVLYTKFDTDKKYSEKEINSILDQWHTFNDAALLRRSLVDQGFLSREKDGSLYWINKSAGDISDYKIV